MHDEVSFNSGVMSVMMRIDPVLTIFLSGREHLTHLFHSLHKSDIGKHRKQNILISFYWMNRNRHKILSVKYIETYEKILLQ